jgi:hypothetical protein
MMGFGPCTENVVTKGSQLATVCWQQQSIGNTKEMNQGQPHPCAFLRCKNIFFVIYEWNAASLFFSNSVGFKRSQVLTTRVSLVNKTFK